MEPTFSYLQNELELDGARVMGIDGSSQIIMVSGKAPGIEREHVLSKVLLDILDIHRK